MDSSRQTKLDAILGRALRDKEYRQKLLDNPKDAAREAGLSPEELEILAGGLAIGSSLQRPGGSVMYCTEKTCNEKGGARVVMFSPDPEFNPTIVVQKNLKNVGEEK